MTESPCCRMHVVEGQIWPQAVRCSNWTLLTDSPERNVLKMDWSRTDKSPLHCSLFWFDCSDSRPDFARSLHRQWPGHWRPCGRVQLCHWQWTSETNMRCFQMLNLTIIVSKGANESWIRIPQDFGRCWVANAVKVGTCLTPWKVKQCTGCRWHQGDILSQYSDSQTSIFRIYITPTTMKVICSRSMINL